MVKTSIAGGEKALYATRRIHHTADTVDCFGQSGLIVCAAYESKEHVTIVGPAEVTHALRALHRRRHIRQKEMIRCCRYAPMTREEREICKSRMYPSKVVR